MWLIEHDRDRSGSRLCGQCRDAAARRDDDRDLTSNQISGQLS
jgi:hypothetical protein